MLIAARDDEITWLGEHAHRDLVRHDARRDEDRLGFGHKSSESLLEFVDGRILVVTNVADLRIHHRFAHRERWLGDRVTAQIDQSGHTERLPSRI